MAKAWDLIFVGEGGALWPLLAWSLLTDSIAVWLSQRMHQVDAADFMRFICFVFLCSSLRLFVCLFRIRTMATLGDSPQFVSMVNSAIQVVLLPKTISSEGMSNCFISRFFPRYLL